MNVDQFRSALDAMEQAADDPESGIARLPDAPEPPPLPQPISFDVSREEFAARMPEVEEKLSRG